MNRLLTRGDRVSNPEPSRLPARDYDTKRDEPPAASPRCRILNSRDLLGDDQEVLIQNGDEIYRLRRTRAGKLILYK
jgi:hemin uptake protein HemP